MPSSDFIDNIPYLEKFWLYLSWAKENSIDIEKYKNQAILIGSFTNPEMAKKMMKGNDYELTEEEFESSWDIVQNQEKPELNDINNRRRRRRKLVNNG